MDTGVRRYDGSFMPFVPSSCLHGYLQDETKTPHSGPCLFETFVFFAPRGENIVVMT
jgi:hypothetical protein